MIAGEHARPASGPSVLLGEEHRGAGVRTVAGGEERQPERVIPMQVAEKDRAREGRLAEQARGRLQSNARVEDQGRRAAPSCASARHEVWPP